MVPEIPASDLYNYAITKLNYFGNTFLSPIVLFFCHIISATYSFQIFTYLPYRLRMVIAM